MTCDVLCYDYGTTIAIFLVCAFAIVVKVFFCD